MVDVDHQARQRPGVALRERHQFAGLNVQPPPAEQPSQAVGRRLGGQGVTRGLLAQRGTDARREFLRLERFDDVVDAAQVQPGDAVGDAVAPRHEDDRRRGRTRGLEPPAHLESGEVRQ